MLRLEMKVNSAKFMSFMNTTMELYKSEFTYFQSFKHSDYRNLWHVEQDGAFDDKFSYAIMYMHNMEKASVNHKLIIEFNPNKCLYRGLLALILKEFVNERTVIKQIDLAIDVDICIDSIIYNNHNRQYVNTIDSSKGKTIYFGKRGNGQIKVYNKAMELGLKNRELTRIEKTIPVDLPISEYYMFDFNNEGFPEFLVPKSIDTLICDFDTKDTLMLLGLRQRPDLMYSLGRKLREKYSKMLEGEKLVFDFKLMNKALETCLNSMASEIFGFKDFR